MNRIPRSLPERLQAALVSEVDFSAWLIDADVPISLRALIIGSNANYRLPLIALPEIADSAALGNMLRSYIQTALLFTVGRAFVLTVPHQPAGSFTIVAVSERGACGLVASLETPFDPSTVESVQLPASIVDELRSCIPPAPAIISPDQIGPANEAFGPGGPYELERVGPWLNPFQYAEGHA